MTLATTPTFSSITTAISSRMGILARALPQPGEAFGFQLAAEQRAKADAGEAEKMVVVAVHLDHEGVAQHMTDGARLDVGALRRWPGAAALVPIFEQLAV